MFRRVLSHGLVARAWFSDSDLQHAIRLLPPQLILNVRGSLCLNDKANQTDEEEYSCHHVLSAGCLFGIAVRAFTPNRRPPRMVQHGPAFCVTISKARSGPAMVVIF